MTDEPDDQQVPPGATRLDVSEFSRAASGANNWRRRFEVEAERAELMEAAVVDLQQTVAGLRQQVKDRDGEIEVLREKLDADAPG